MKKNKVFVACDTTNINKIKKIINETQSSKLKVG
jgi:orotidine-5'-phosphate decarboxylase